MRNKFWTCLVLLIVISGLVFTVSCSKKTVKSEESISEMPKSEIDQDSAATDRRNNFV